MRNRHIHRIADLLLAALVLALLWLAFVVAAALYGGVL